MMKFIYLITFLSFAHTSVAASAAARASATADETVHTCDHLVAFSTRAFGKLDPSLTIRFQKDPAKLDPTYRDVFASQGGTVVSLDINPCDIEGEPHIQGDILQVAMAPGCLKTLVMELPPSTIPPADPATWTKPEGLINRTFLPTVIKRTFDWLQPGGKIFIDHWPFFLVLGKKLVEVGATPATAKVDPYKAILPVLEAQNPFHLFMTYQEAAEISLYLINPAYAPNFKAFTKAKQEALDAAFEAVWEIMKDALVMETDLSKRKRKAAGTTGIVAIGKETPRAAESDKAVIRNLCGQNWAKQINGGKPLDQIWHLVIGEYAMVLHQPMIKEFMKRIGYVGVTVERMPSNPYNGRTNIWAIQGRKPAAADPSTATSAASLVDIATAAGSGGVTASSLTTSRPEASAKGGFGE